MPTYDYVCRTCGHAFEAFQRMSDAPLEHCPCEKAEPVQRKIGTGAGIIFKGGGFYETDFKTKKGKPAGESAEKKDNASGDSKPASEAKPAPAAGSAKDSAST